jgi:autoinducer 2-degrading protein
MSFVLVVSLEVVPEHLEEFRREIRINAEASLRDEPGCLRFDVHQVVGEPCRCVLYEIYEDEDAFRVDHRTAPHYARWQAATKRCIVPGGHVNTFCTPAFPG